MSVLGEEIKTMIARDGPITVERYMELALALVDYVTVMQNGRIIVECDPRSIRDNPLVQEVYLGRPRELQGTASRSHVGGATGSVV